MGLAWRYFLFLLWFSYLLISSILLFTSGFLLTRITQPLNSSCFQYTPSCAVDEEHCHENLMNYLYDASHTCLPPKAKVILVIIDALRYDFAKYDVSNLNPMAFQNKLPVINKLLESKPESTRLYKFIADPPTTTMQRLKALTTGSLPTFIDAGSNFATSEINEDNIIDQLLSRSGETVFLGDDTWVSLYPRRFKRMYPFPSFNVFDLDTVDDGILHNLHFEMEKNDWNLLVAHFLGVDHCGHRYGPSHSEMARKLTQMNRVIEDIVESLDEGTVLIVIGDHGMTTTGDHGGESHDEVTSAMFVHSKLALVQTDGSFDNDTIKQIDLVPTLCTILGIPIPYSNLGSLIVDALPVSNETLPFLQWQIELFASWSNIQQMTKYIKQYATTSQTFSQEKLQKLYEKFALLNARVRTISNEDAYKVFMSQAKDYTILIRQMCEEVWIQFDSFSMSRGLVLTFMSIFLTYMIVSGIPSSRLPEIFTSSFVPCSYIVLCFAALIAAACFYYNLTDNLPPTVYFSTGSASIFMLAVLVIQNWETISIHWYNLSKNRSFVDLFYRLIFLLTWCGLLSNSFIVEEGNASMFLLITVIALIVYNNEAQKKSMNFNSKWKLNSTKVKALALFFLISFIIRLSTLYGKCREEQRWCLQSSYGEGIKKAFRSEKAEYLISLVAVAVFVSATRNWLRACGNLSGYSLQVLLAKYAPTVIVVAIGGFWVLHALPHETKSKITMGVHADSLALVVYAFVITGIGSIIFKPLCIEIIQPNNEALHKSNRTIPHIFNQVKGLFNKTKLEGDQFNVPIVCGLGTVYSGTFVVIGVYIILLIALLLGDVAAPSVILLYFSSALILAIAAMSRVDGSGNLSKVFDVPTAYVMAWMLVSLYFFYGMGHQATFPNIPWEAAFIGTGGDFTSNYVPALLVIINTFGSHIFMGITLPMLFIVPFTFYVMFPSLCGKKQEDISHGEILLYERDGTLFTSVFTVSCRYILFHAVRVFVSMLAATIHCRHLMVWKIFAPKLIFEAIGLSVTLLSVLSGFLLLICINCNVDKLLTNLNKKSR